MTYAWFIFAIVTSLVFSTIFGRIADALSAIAVAWLQYLGEIQPIKQDESQFPQPTMEDKK
jgi:hypothetical protein